MKSKFFNYYRPGDAWFSELWKTCTFVVDANVILNLYRYSPETSEQLFATFEGIQERLWIPYQAALEYQRKRLDVISAEMRTYSDTIQQSRALRESLVSSRRPPFADENIVADILSSLDKLEGNLQKTQSERDELFVHDPFQERIANLFEERVGDALPKEIENNINYEGQQRYEKRIPPGYKDDDKEGDQKYGDLRIWFQILELAQTSQKNIVFITDDTKEDWWHNHKGKVIGPRPELISEIMQKAGIMFYMYQPSRFMEHAHQFLNQEVKSETIAEIKELTGMRLVENVRIYEGELLENIPRKYKAFRRFITNHRDVRHILNLYIASNFLSYDVDTNPNSLPSDLLDELYSIVRDRSDVVKAIQAIHSLPPAVFQQQVKQIGIPSDMLSDAYLTNQLPGAFIRILDVLHDLGKPERTPDPRLALEIYLRQRYKPSRSDDLEEGENGNYH